MSERLINAVNTRAVSVSDYLNGNRSKGNSWKNNAFFFLGVLQKKRLMLAFFQFFCFFFSFTPRELISHLQACGERQEVDVVADGILGFACLQEMREENTFGWIRENTSHKRQQVQTRIIKAHQSIFPLSHSFAQNKIMPQHPSGRWESTGVWPKKANRNPGQALPVCLSGGGGLYLTGLASSAHLRSNSAVQPAGTQKKNIRASYTLQRLMSGKQHWGILMENGAAKGEPPFCW